MSFSNLMEENLLNWVFDIGTPAAVLQGSHLAVFTSNPEAQANAADITTFEAADFARIDVSGATDFTLDPNAGNTRVYNTNVITFTNASLVNDTTITHVGLVDAASGAATVIAYAALTTARLVPAEADLEFAAQAITFELN